VTGIDDVIETLTLQIKWL